MTSLSHSIYGDPDRLPTGVVAVPVETSDLYPLASFSGLISSTILTTSIMFGLFSGNLAVQAIPTCSISTISSSTWVHVISSSSNTSPVHSSLTTEFTHLTRLATSDFHVNTSNIKTPKLYTSDN